MSRTATATYAPTRAAARSAATTGRAGAEAWVSGVGEGAEHEGVEAERPDTGAGLGVGHASPPAVCLL